MTESQPYHEELAKRFGRSSRLTILRQTEPAECGLVCLAMISSFWGLYTDVQTLRQRYVVSSRGLNMFSLIRIAGLMGLTCRPVRLDVDDLGSLKLPAILHWELKHYVVLAAVRRQHIIVHDPRIGRRRVPHAELQRCFTGVAMEVWPSQDFKPEQRSEVKSWRQLLGRPQGISAFFAKLLAIGLCLQSLSLVLPLLTQWGIDNVAASGDLDLLTLITLGMALLFGIQIILGLVRGWLVVNITTSFILRWKLSIFVHMTRLPLSFFQQRRVGDITSRYDSVERIIGIVNDNFVEGTLDGLTSMTTILIMFIYNAELTMITLSGATIYLTARFLRANVVREATQQDMVADARENSSLIETIRGIRIVKLFARDTTCDNRWFAAAIDEANADLALSRTKIMFRALSASIGGLEQAVVFWLSLRMITTQQMTIGMVIAFNAYRSQFYGSATSFADNILDLQTVKIHAERVGDIVLTQAEELRPSDDQERVGQLSAKISCQDLQFRYGDYEKMVLDGITLDIESGESVAFIGRSGCGKTSLLLLLIGLYEPTNGSIFLGGIPVKSLGLELLRQEVSAVLQDDMLFAGTIASNIAAFENSIDLDRVMECGRVAEVHSEILAMPMGYGTLVTDGGNSLSGGQRQRVCIARALYRRPKILVMDEATSHLDIATERLVNQNIRDLGVTRIIVAHRLETICSTDRYILLNEGKVVNDTRTGVSREETIKMLAQGDFGDSLKRRSDSIPV